MRPTTMNAVTIAFDYTSLDICVSNKSEVAFEFCVYVDLKSLNSYVSLPLRYRLTYTHRLTCAKFSKFINISHVSICIFNHTNINNTHNNAQTLYRFQYIVTY